MRRLIKLSALSLFFISQNAMAGQNCLIILIGGAKEWLTLFIPTLSTDISIDVDAAARREAKRTGCRVISGANQSENEFKEMIKKASKPPYFTPGTTVHLSFTDHGTPQPGNGKGSLYIGKGTAIQNQDFAKLLTDNFPQGSRLTYATNICWGSMTEMVTAFNLDSKFDICGGTSTHPDHYSWNARRLNKVSSVTTGPYTAVGLSNAADQMDNGQKAPSVVSFHKNAKLGDISNLIRIPGFISSTTFARSTLKTKKSRAEVDQYPLQALFNFRVSPVEAENLLRGMGLQKMKSDILKTMSPSAQDNCPPNQHGPFHDFLDDFRGVYERLTEIVPDNLPEPYKSQALQSSRWLMANKDSLALHMAAFIKAKADFWAKNKARAKDPKQSGALIAEWESLESSLKNPLTNYLFHMRNLQESKTVADFLVSATHEEKARFQKFLACERRPVL